MAQSSPLVMHMEALHHQHKQKLENVRFASRLMQERLKLQVYEKRFVTMFVAVIVPEMY